MNILVVEDQEDKSDDIVLHLRDIVEERLSCTVRGSLRSGLKELVDFMDYDLIILDMSMPNFDPSVDDPVGGTPESFAGREFLFQMNVRKIFIPVVVVTQYSIFSRGAITLDDINSELNKKYGEFYLGAVYYSSSSNQWKSELKNIIRGL